MAESIAELLASALSKNWTRYRLCLKKCQKEPKTEAVHDLRTSIRRMIATLRLSQEILRPKRKMIRRVRKTLKVELHLMRSLRDYQVQLRLLDRKKEFPTLSKLLREEVDSEKKRVSICLNKKLQRKIRKSERRLFRLHADLLSHGKIRADEKSAMRVLDSAHQQVLAAAKKAKIQDVTTIHQVRIEFKKFRYEREVLVPVLKEPRNRPHQLDEIQTVFGDIQDHETMIQTTEMFLVKGRFRAKAKWQRAAKEGKQFIEIENLKKTQLMEELLKNREIEIKLREIKPVRKLQIAS